MEIKDLISNWNNRNGDKYLGKKLDTVTMVEKRVPKYPYFTETFKVMNYLDQEEKRLSKEMSYTEELKLYEDELKNAKNEEEYERIENRINRLKRVLKMNMKKISVTIPEEKVQVILDNHRIENEAATKKYNELKNEQSKVKEEIKKLQEKEKELNQQASTLNRLIDQADVLPYVINSYGSTIVLAHNKEDQTVNHTVYRKLLDLTNWHIESKHPYKTVKDVK